MKKLITLCIIVCVVSGCLAAQCDTAYTPLTVQCDTDAPGQLYKADEPYADFITPASCARLGGTVCMSSLCDGFHYPNEYCCCYIQYNRERPVIDPAILTSYGIDPKMQSTYFTTASAS
jgi:hypothetical protein